jgi:hypothetical protein
MRDYRAEMEHRQREDSERRRLEVIEQTAVSKTPEARIRIWEHRHRLSMPRNPEHHLIDVIAGATALSRAQVLEEQRQRAEMRAATPADQPQL